MKKYLFGYVIICLLVGGCTVTTGTVHKKAPARATKTVHKKAPAKATKTVHRKAPAKATKKNNVFMGKASYYGSKFQGKPTASGEAFDMNKHTAAHKTLPFGTKVRVTNQNNGKFVVVRINDRGPFTKGRIIDLSLAAAKKINMIKQGVVKVKLEVLK